MTRLCFALDLVEDDDLIREYERAHAAGAVWPEVTAGLRARGFEAIEIWRTGDRLFMIADVTNGQPREVPAELAAADARWEAAMSRFQKPLPQATKDEKWVAMTRIFSLAEQ